MARIRTIKPEFCSSESLAKVSRDARLLFVSLWTQCDDEGRMKGNSRFVASACFPYDDDAVKKVPTWLAELEKEECIQRYDVKGSTYLLIPNWANHQKIDRPSKSRIPPPPTSDANTLASPREDSSSIREPSRGQSAPVASLPAESDAQSRGFDADLGPRTMDHGPSTVDLGPQTIADAGSERGLTETSRKKSHFDAWWEQYPRKVNRGAALKAYDATVKKLHAVARDAHPVLLEAVTAYAASPLVASTELEFIPHASTWLSGARYDDDRREWARARAGPANEDPRGNLGVRERFLINQGIGDGDEDGT